MTPLRKCPVISMKAIRCRFVVLVFVICFFCLGNRLNAASLPAPQDGNEIGAPKKTEPRESSVAKVGPFFGNGIKIGETTSDSAIIWTRLTKNKQAEFSRLKIFTQGLPNRKRDRTTMPTKIHPGSPGMVVLTYWEDGKKGRVGKRRITGQVDPDADYTVQIPIVGLKPDTRYELELQARKEPGNPATDKIQGSFRTAGGRTSTKPVRFMVSTCQAVRSIDSGKEGHVAYKQMNERNPAAPAPLLASSGSRAVFIGIYVCLVPCTMMVCETSPLRSSLNSARSSYPGGSTIGDPVAAKVHRALRALSPPPHARVSTS